MKFKLLLMMLTYSISSVADTFPRPNWVMNDQKNKPTIIFEKGSPNKFFCAISFYQQGTKDKILIRRLAYNSLDNDWLPMTYGTADQQTELLSYYQQTVASSGELLINNPQEKYSERLSVLDYANGIQKEIPVFANGKFIVKSSLGESLPSDFFEYLEEAFCYSP